LSQNLKKIGVTIKWISIRPLENFLMNLTTTTYYQVKTKSNDGCGFCPNVTFEDNEFKDNKAWNDQGKDEGTIIVKAQLNLNMSWSLN
jgi:hypothetical protein